MTEPTGTAGPTRPGRPSPARSRPASRLPRAIFLCLSASVLLGLFTEWPVWACVAVAVATAALLSGLVTGYLRGGAAGHGGRARPEDEGP